MLALVVAEAWNRSFDARRSVRRELEALGADWLYLFVAPEYYFAASDSAHAIPQTQKDQIVGFLRALSSEHPTLVLVPGTIAWKKPVLRSGPKAYKKGTMIPKERGRYEKFLERITSARDAELDLVSHAVDRDVNERVARAGTDLGAIRRIRTDYRQIATQNLAGTVTDTYDRRLRMGAKLKENADRCSIARNTAYGFYNGREVARYHKRSDYMEVFPSESDGGFVIYEPGGGPEGPGSHFEVESVRFGVEVCLDHQIGFLSQSGGWYPDIQIIMSADTPLVHEHSFTVEGGYVVHASSNPDYTGVSRKVNGLITPVATVDERTYLGELRYAVLQLEAETGLHVIDDYVPVG